MVEWLDFIFQHFKLLCNLQIIQLAVVKIVVEMHFILLKLMDGNKQIQIFKKEIKNKTKYVLKTIVFIWHLSPQSRPLTRYLPARRDDFDLRSHIEAAGHHPDTCFHLVITDKTCRGFLIKMGGKIKTWKKRWFVFDRNRRTLVYYAGTISLFVFKSTWFVMPS